MPASVKNDAYSAAVLESRMRLNEYSKSWALTGLPSLYLAPWRRWKVYVLPSWETSKLEAAAGTGLRSLSNVSSGSNTREMTAPSVAKLLLFGSILSGSPCSALTLMTWSPDGWRLPCDWAACVGWAAVVASGWAAD